MARLLAGMLSLAVLSPAASLATLCKMSAVRGPCCCQADHAQSPCSQVTRPACCEVTAAAGEAQPATPVSAGAPMDASPLVTWVHAALVPLGMAAGVRASAASPPGVGRPIYLRLCSYIL